MQIAGIWLCFIISIHLCHFLMLPWVWTVFDRASSGKRSSHQRNIM